MPNRIFAVPMPPPWDFINVLLPMESLQLQINTNPAHAGTIVFGQYNDSKPETILTEPRFPTGKLAT
jgi:hypothetical protein